MHVFIRITISSRHSGSHVNKMNNLFSKKKKFRFPIILTVVTFGLSIYSLSTCQSWAWWLASYRRRRCRRRDFYQRRWRQWRYDSQTTTSSTRHGYWLQLKSLKNLNFSKRFWRVYYLKLLFRIFITLTEVHILRTLITVHVSSNKSRTSQKNVHYNRDLLHKTMKFVH